MTASDSGSAMRNVEKAAAEVVAAHSALRLQMMRAHEAGVSLRKIADLAGMSHETVRRIVSD